MILVYNIVDSDNWTIQFWKNQTKEESCESRCEEMGLIRTVHG